MHRSWTIVVAAALAACGKHHATQFVAGVFTSTSPSLARLTALFRVSGDDLQSMATDGTITATIRNRAGATCSGQAAVTKGMWPTQTNWDVQVEIATPGCPRYAHGQGFQITYRFAPASGDAFETVEDLDKYDLVDETTSACTAVKEHPDGDAAKTARATAAAARDAARAAILADAAQLPAPLQRAFAKLLADPDPCMYEFELHLGPPAYVGGENWDTAFDGAVTTFSQEVSFEKWPDMAAVAKQIAALLEPVGHDYLHFPIVDHATTHGLNFNLEVGASDTVSLGARSLPRLGATISGNVVVGSAPPEYLFLDGATFEPNGQTVAFTQATDTRSGTSQSDASARAIHVMAQDIIPRLDPVKLLRRQAGSAGKP